MEILWFVVESLVVLCLAVSPAASVSQPRPRPSFQFRPDPHTYMTFNYEENQVSSYNPKNQRCCSGNLLAKESNSYRRCCGNGDYDSTIEVCCDNSMNAKQIGFECCDKEYFNVSEKLCCRSALRAKLIEFPEAIRDSPATRRNTQCCGARLYDTRIQLCCNLPSPNAASVRVVDKLYPNTICCKGKPFNGRTGFCNDNNIHILPLPRPGPFPPFPGRPFPQRPFPPPPFPGRPPFLPGRPFPMPRPVRPFTGFQNFQPPPKPEFGSGIRVTINSPIAQSSFQPAFLNRCNGKQFNRATHLCCGVYKPNDINPESDLIVRPRESVTTACCGANTFDFTKQMCCDGEVQTMDLMKPKTCCGKEVYDPATQWCCDAASSTVESSKETDGDYCCGAEGKVYSYDKQVCCGGKLLDISTGLEASSVACCVGSSGETPSLFNTTNQKCCDGTIVTLPEGTAMQQSHHLQCCGKELINFRRSECCNGVSMARMGNQSCCRGKTVFNPSTQLCCSNSVVEKETPRHTLCCGDKAYNPHNETCCANLENGESTITMRNRTFRYSSCCAGTSYDPTQQSCCNGELVSKDVLCCSSFNDEGEIEFLAITKTNRTNRCCGLSEYNPIIERCCKNTIIPIQKGNNFCCGPTAYNSATHMCCGERLSERQGEDAVNACCGKTGYNTTASICCGGHLKDRTEGQVSGCCFPHQIDWN